MTDQTGVKPGEADIEAEAGEGAADQERKVPLSALIAERKARQDLATELAQVKGLVEGLKAGQQNQQKDTPVYSRAELKRAVEQGKISDDEMESIWEQQVEKRIAAEVQKTTENTFGNASREAQVSNQIAAYAEKLPDLRDKDSDAFRRVREEYDFLVSAGDPKDSLLTELKAIRAAFGPVDRIKRAKANRPETHQEGSDRGGDFSRSQNDEDGAPGDIPARFRTFYRTQINKGIYNGWDDEGLKKEIAHIRKSKKAA